MIDARLQLIEYGTDEYYQAAQLRYRLFYQEYQIPFESICEPQEQQDLHLALLSSENIVLAYARLSQNSTDEFQIHQMVVLPELQGKGFGTRMLQGLTETAIDRGARCLVLNARTTKVQFYQKAGFESMGEVFASSMTGVPHIRMRKEIASQA